MVSWRNLAARNYKLLVLCHIGVASAEIEQKSSGVSISTLFLLCPAKLVSLWIDLYLPVSAKQRPCTCGIYFKTHQVFGAVVGETTSFYSFLIDYLCCFFCLIRTSSSIRGNLTTHFSLFLLCPGLKEQILQFQLILILRKSSGNLRRNKRRRSLPIRENPRRNNQN